MRKKRFSVEQMMGILKQAEVGCQPHLAAERAGAAHAGERVRRRRIFRRGQLRRVERAAQRSPRHVRRAVRGAGAVPCLQRGIRVLRGQPHGRAGQLRRGQVVALQHPADADHSPVGASAASDFYDAYHELSGRVNAASAQASFRLEGGQILLGAGHRVLHGRTALRSNGRRHLQDTYFEHDNVRNHLRWRGRTGRI